MLKLRKYINSVNHCQGALEMSKSESQPVLDELRILREAVESTNEGFVTIDEDHRVIFFNRAAEKIFGYSREEVIGRDLTTIMSPSCAKDHKSAVKRYLDTGMGKSLGHERELLATRKNGQQFPAAISFSVTLINSKHFFTGLVRDTTETKLLQQRILHSERLAALGQLVAEITHEIKNPLMTIGGFARQLQRNVTNDKDLKKLNIIVSEIKRLEELLRDLGDYYLPRKLELGPIDVVQLLKEIRTMVKPDCEKRHIHIATDFDEAIPPALADEARLKQVFINLVKNAIEATEEKGGIRLEAKSVAQNIMVRIIDNGPGIPKDDLPRIFEPFFTTKTQGSGLGLCVTKRIIDEHPGASIRVESQEGQGTTFEIILAPYEQGKHP